MNLLAIETSTSRASVALQVENQLFLKEEANTKQHAPVLLGMIHDLLSNADVTLQAIDGIVFGQGPGSFTGVRIACSVAKGLAYAHDLPLFPVGGLQAISFEVYSKFKMPVLAIIDARMNQIYWSFDAMEETEIYVSAPEKVNIPRNTPIVLAGVGTNTYAQALPKHVFQAITYQVEIFPDAGQMIAIAETGKIQMISAKEAVPMYVRNQVTGG